MAAEPNRKLDYSDYLATPDDGKRYQIVEGNLLVNPSPSPVHQRVSRRLQRQLEDYFQTRTDVEVFDAPIDLFLSNHDILVPDLLVVADPAQVTKRGIEGPALLVVAILSPSTSGQDRGVKSRRYAELGVGHYWIVDPDRKHMECFRSEKGEFLRVAEGQGNTALAHPDFDGLRIDLAALWR